MSQWKPIGTLPDEMRDGREVYVRRVHDGRLVKEGLACFASAAADAPMRRPIDEPSVSFRAPFVETQAQRDVQADQRRWLKPALLHAFPEPTEWLDHEDKVP